MERSCLCSMLQSKDQILRKLTNWVITKVCRLRGAKSKSFAGEAHMSSDCKKTAAINQESASNCQ